MPQLHVDNDVRWIQQQTQVCLIVRENGVAISKFDVLKLGKLANKLNCIVCRDSRFLDVMKASLNLAMLFEKEYNEEFSATRNVDIVKDVIVSVLLIEMSDRFYHQNIQVGSIMLWHESIFAVVKV